MHMPRLDRQPPKDLPVGPRQWNLGQGWEMGIRKGGGCHKGTRNIFPKGPTCNLQIMTFRYSMSALPWGIEPVTL